MKKRSMLKTLLAAALIGVSAAFAEDAPVKGNPKSKVYHLPLCKHYQAKGTTVEFKSEAEARKAGYKPCKICSKADRKSAASAEKK